MNCKCFLFIIVIIITGCNNGKEYATITSNEATEIQYFLDQSNDSQIAVEQQISYLDSTLPKLKKIDNLKFQKDIYADLSLEYDKRGAYEKSKLMDEAYLNLAIELKDSTEIAQAYYNLGVYHWNKDIESAYSFFNESEKIYRAFSQNNENLNKNFYFNHGKVLLFTAEIFQITKDYNQAEQLAIEAIKKFERAENLSYLPKSFSLLGTIAKYLRRYDDAIKYHKQALEYAKDTDKKSLYSFISNNNIGTVYKTQKKYDLARQFYNYALNNTSFLKNNIDKYALLVDNRAYVNFLSNNLKNIPEDFFKTLKIRDSINDKKGLITNNIHLAEYYKTILNDSLAIVFALNASNLAKELDNNEELLQSYKLLSEVTPKEEGLTYANKYIALNDSLIQQERAFRDKFARIRFETDQAEEKIVQISRKNQFLIIVTIILAVLSLLGYVIFKQRQKNNELVFAQTQQETNQEIYRLLLTQQAKLEEGRKLEQQRMSEELHDGVLGRLFGVRLSLDGINQRTNDEFSDTRNKYNQELKDIEKEIRLISHDLGSETLAKDIAYVDVVESLISDLCEVHKVEFEFNNDENIDWEFIADPKKVNLFRIIQESMQNIFKHAKATKIKISFHSVDSEIKLIIEDNGVGFKKDKVKKGIGLKNITSRVRQMNGAVDFVSENGLGTQVSVEIPLQP